MFIIFSLSSQSLNQYPFFSLLTWILVSVSAGLSLWSGELPDEFLSNCLWNDHQPHWDERPWAHSPLRSGSQKETDGSFKTGSLEGTPNKGPSWGVQGTDWGPGTGLQSWDFQAFICWAGLSRQASLSCLGTLWARSQQHSCPSVPGPPPWWLGTALFLGAPLFPPRWGIQPPPSLPAWRGQTSRAP